MDINESTEIINMANDIEKRNIKPKDSLHLSCAIIAECDYFITTDDKILSKLIDNIIIIDPLDFIKLPGVQNES